MLRSSALLVLVVLGLVGAQALADELPVRIELKLPAGVNTVDDAARLWKKEGKQVKLEAAEGKSRLVRSCVEYERSRGEGFSMEETMHDRCTPLLLKKTLRPARRSFVRDYKLDGKSVGNLPAILGFGIGEMSYGQEVDRAIANGTSFRSYAITLSDELKLKVEKTTPLKLTFRTPGPDEPDLYELKVLGWGDWNGDGLDDLILETYHAYLRNAAETCLLVLTRKSRTDRFRIVGGRCAISNNSGDDGTKPIERRFLTLGADLSCSGDAADEERARFDRRYRTSELAKAYAALLQLYDRCRTRLAAPQRVRLVGTLMLGAHHLKKQADCRRLARERTEKEIYASARSMKALRHNIKLCLPGEKVEDPTAKYDK